MIAPRARDMLTPQEEAKSDATQKPVLTAREVASLLQVSESHVTTCASRGILPGRKMGSRWLFSRDQLMRWLEEGNNGRTSKTRA